MKLLELFNHKLLEYNKNFLIKTYGDKINNIVSKKEIDINNIEELLNKLDNFIKKNYDANTAKILDPYIKWIIDRYSKNSIENFNTITKQVIDDLLIYDKIKKSKKLPQNIPDDINQIKSSDQLKNIVNKIFNIKTKREKRKDEEKYLINNNLAEIIYEDSRTKFVKINSYTAGCFYGIGTKWCISTTDEENKGKSYFDYYSKKGDLYVIIDKNKSKKYLVSFAAKKIRDEKDSPIDIEEFKSENFYDKFLEFFKKEIFKYNYIELLPSNFETLYSDYYLRKFIERSFFSKSNIVHDINIINNFVDNIKKINEKEASLKILKKFSDIFENYIKNKNNQEIFNIYNYYGEFLKKLIDENIEIPNKLKNLSKEILKYYDLKFVPKYFLNIFD